MPVGNFTHTQQGFSEKQMLPAERAFVFEPSILDFPGSSDGKESACNAGDLGWIPASGRFPGEGNGNPLQYSCQEHTMDRGAWRATVHEVTKESDMTE